jgi:hypothetical protein
LFGKADEQRDLAGGVAILKWISVKEDAGV